MREVLQEGTTVKVPASENRKQAARLLGGGAAARAGEELTKRRSRLEEAERKDVGYAGGGTVTAKKDKELDAPIPAGGMVRSGGKLVPRFSRDMGPNEPIRPMKDKGQGLEVERDRYAAGGTVKSRRGYGKARGA